MTRRRGRDMREGMRGTANGRATTALALALMAGLAAAPAEAEPRGPVRAAADIAPVHSLVAMVMRDAGAPTLIVPPGASPHGYALRPSQARALQEAEIVFRIGPGLTPWLEEALEDLAGDAVSITLAEVPGISHLPIRDDAMFEAKAAPHVHGKDHAEEQGEDHGEGKDDHAGHGDHEDHDDHDDHEDHDGHGDHADHADAPDHDGHDAHGDRDDHAGHDHAPGADDPHMWLNPDNAVLWLDVIEAALSEADPDRADLYAANADAARARIAAATRAAEAGLAPVHGRPYAVFHDAYAHFEARFDMPALGALALSDGAKPGARHLAALRDKLVEAGARCVFFEPQFPPRMVSAITEGTGIRHADLDPLGAELAPGPALYPTLIEAMAEAMAGCLKD